MHHIKLLLFLASLSCLSLHCKKESELDKLPPATANGANTFGCLLNGKAWPMGRGGYQYSEVSYESGKLYIHYFIKSDPLVFMDKEWVSFTTNKIHQPGAYFITYSPDTDFFSVQYKDIFYSSGVIGAPISWAYIIINRLDSINKVVSGSFDFTVSNMGSNSQMKVSSGRFDFHY